jgi:uncharacterized protein YjbI with pentapeptide repeats
MAPKNTDETQPPNLESVQLADLVAGFAGDLGAREVIEGLAFDGVDVSGADLTALTVRECSFAECAFGDADLCGSTFVTCTVHRLDAPVLRAARSRLREVEVANSRIGSGELYESTLEGVRFTDCKLGYLNLRGAELTDVLFDGCTIDELDLGEAHGTRIAFRDTAIDSLDVSRARLTEFDLRGAELHTITGLEGLSGATMSELQISLMAGIFARHLGIRAG